MPLPFYPPFYRASVGGGLRWLLRDEFTTDRAAGAVNGTAAEPGPGTRTAVDTTGKLSISSGNVALAASGAYTDPVITFPSVATAAGRVLVAQVTRLDALGAVNVGFWENVVASSSRGAGLRMTSGGTLTAQDLTAMSAGSANVGTFGAASYKVAVILRATGMMLLIKGGAFSNWTLLHVGRQYSVSPSVPMISANGATNEVLSSYFRVPDTLWLPTPLLSDGFGSAFGTSDGLGSAEGIAGGIGSGGAGVTFSNAGGTWSVSGGKAINTPSVGAELLTDGDMEAAGLTGWTTQGTPTTLEKSSAQAHGGSQSMHLVSPSTFTGALRAGVTALGTWYKYSVWAYGVAGQCRLQATGSGLNISNDQTVGSTWTKIQLTFRGTVSAAINCYMSGWSSSEYYFDDLSLVPLTLSELLTLSNLACADVYAGVAVVRGSTYVQAGLALNWDSATSPANGLIVYVDGATIKVDKCVAGTWTNVSSTACTYSAGARLVCTMNAGALRVYYNNALITTATIVDAGILTGQLHGLFSSDVSNTLDDLTVYATGVNNEYSALDAWSS